MTARQRLFVTALFPTIAFLVAYIGMTAFAGTLYALPNGTVFPQILGVVLPPAVVADVGTALYFTLLYSPILITPAVAFAVIKFGSNGFLSQHQFDDLKISRLGLVVTIAISFGYCFFRLNQFGALNFDAFSCGSLEIKLGRRMAILDGLGYVYFMFAYGINMMLPLLAYLLYTSSRRVIDMVIFFVALLGMTFFVALTYSKAPTLVFVIMLVPVVILRRAPILHFIMICLVCDGAVVTSAVAFNTSTQCAETAPASAIAKNETSDSLSLQQQQTYTPPGSETGPSSSKKATDPKSPSKPAPSSQQLPVQKAEIAQVHTGFIESPMEYLRKLLGFSVVQRIAIGFPFYVHAYKDGDALCGIQGSLLRKITGAPAPKCVMGTQVFKIMWPMVSGIDGNQPAGAVISAFGELGLTWALVVCVLAGLALGALGLTSVSARGPLFAAISAAGCGFGYYLAQVPFVASFTYPHGLIPFLIPIVVLLVIGFFAKRRGLASAVAED